MSRYQKAGRSHSTEGDSIYFTRVEEFKYFGTTIENENYIQEE